MYVSWTVKISLSFDIRREIVMLLAVKSPSRRTKRVKSSNLMVAYLGGGEARKFHQLNPIFRSNISNCIQLTVTA